MVCALYVFKLVGKGAGGAYNVHIKRNEGDIRGIYWLHAVYWYMRGCTLSVGYLKYTEVQLRS